MGSIKDIESFIRKELHNRGKNIPLETDTQILTTKLLDSLFLVDLIVYLENEFPQKSTKIGKATKADLDSLRKIADFLDLK